MSDIKQQADDLMRKVWDEGYQAGVAAGRKSAVLKASDAINDLVNRLWLDHERVLQGWADDLGVTLHTGIPGRDVTPRNNSVE